MRVPKWAFDLYRQREAAIIGFELTLAEIRSLPETA